MKRNQVASSEKMLKSINVKFKFKKKSQTSKMVCSGFTEFRRSEGLLVKTRAKFKNVHAGLIEKILLGGVHGK